MAFYEVDLIDSDGAVASTAAAEQNFWNADSSQAAAWAQQAGYGLQVSGNPPAPGAAERNLYSFADFQQWLASQNSVGGVAKAKPAAAAGNSGALVLGLVLVGGVIAGVLLVSATQR